MENMHPISFETFMFSKISKNILFRFIEIHIDVNIAVYYIWNFDRVMWDWNMHAKNIATRRIYVYAVKCLQCNFIFSMKLSMLLRWLFVTKSTVHLKTFNRIHYTYVDFRYCCRLLLLLLLLPFFILHLFRSFHIGK